MGAARNAAEDNIPDYLQDLYYATEGSSFEEVEEDIVAFIYKNVVTNSVAYMMMSRLGVDTDGYFELDDFRDVTNFNTQETLNALGFATSDIAEMGLTEVSKTITALNRQNRIIVGQDRNEYNKVEVATDNDKEEFLEILRTGIVNKEMKSKYACNFRFFQNNIDEFLSKYPTYFAYLPTRIMNNCILLPIEAESQDTALRIFSTLNDRGKPLSDADIFKAQFYKHFSKLGKKEEFIAQWKKLEELCERIFHPISGTPMDELFTRYMYFVRAKMGIVSSTTEALRKFYEKNSYALLKDGGTANERENLSSILK